MKLWADCAIVIIVTTVPRWIWMHGIAHQKTGVLHARGVYKEAWSGQSGNVRSCACVSRRLTGGELADDPRAI